MRHSILGLIQNTADSYIPFHSVSSQGCGPGYQDRSNLLTSHCLTTLLCTRGLQGSSCSQAACSAITSPSHSQHTTYLPRQPNSCQRQPLLLLCCWVYSIFGDVGVLATGWSLASARRVHWKHPSGAAIEELQQVYIPQEFVDDIALVRLFRRYTVCIEAVRVREISSPTVRSSSVVGLQRPCIPRLPNLSGPAT